MAEKVLLYIVNYGEGHISGIAERFNIPKSQVRKQILKLAGNSKMFQINPRCAYRKELVALLEKVLSLLSTDEQKNFSDSVDAPEEQVKNCDSHK